MSRCICNRWELLKYFPESPTTGINPECSAHPLAMPLQVSLYDLLGKLKQKGRIMSAISADDSYDDIEEEKEVIADPVPEEELYTEY